MKNFTKFILFLTAGLMMAVNVWGDVTPQTYCNYVLNQAEGKSIKVTWQTLRNGDVRIDIADNEGVSETTFRNGAFEGGMNGFEVLSGEGYATVEAASVYFTREWANNSSVFYLRKKSGVTLPDPCVIAFRTEAMAWKNDADDNAYIKPCPFDYEYGTNCQSLTAPTNVAISSTGRVSFNEVAGADNYEVTIYDGATLIHSQDIANNDILDFVATSTTTLSVYVRAIKGDYAGPRSDEYAWAVEAGHVYAHSHICDKTMDQPTPNGVVGSPIDAQHSLIGFTWETKRNGNVLITLSEKDGGEAGTALFRGNGMSITSFQINGVANDGENVIFETEATHQNLNYYTLKLKEGKSAPANGTHITFNATVEYKTATSTNAWPTLSFDYVYGTKCSSADGQNPVISTFTATPGKSSITFHVEASDVDDESTDQTSLLTYHIVNVANGIDQDVILDGSGNFTLSGLKKNIISSYTLTAIDPSENTASRTIDVAMDFDTEDNLALNKTCSAGGYEGENGPSKANDGNTGTYWGTYGLGDYGTKNYWTVTLDEAYVLNKMSLYAGGYGGGAAHKVTLQGKMREEDAWSDIITDMTVAEGSDNENIAINAAAKYLKVSAAADENWMFAIDEFEVYGTDYAVADAVAPVVTVTEISKTVTSVILQIDATDKDDAGDDGTINAIHISGDNGFVTQNDVTLDGSNRITLSGLKDNTTYTFTVHVIDLAGNETTKDIVVELPFNTNLNLCHAGTATDGYHEDTNTTAAKAIDGVADTKWNSWNVGTSEGGYANNWMRVDLGSAYNLRNVTMSFDWHYGNPVSEYVIEGSLDDSNWYLIDHVTNQSATSASLTVSAPAQYVRFRAITEQSLGIYEFEVYASGFSTLEDAAPVVTYAKVGLVEDATAEIEIDAADITTKPITKYMVSGLGGDAQELTASDGKITLTSLSQSTHYTVDIQAKDESGNLSAAKQVEFTTTGSVSGLYCYAGFFGWGEKTQDCARFSTTAEPGVLTLVVSNVAAGDQNFKLYNADGDRCTWGHCAGESDHHFAMASAADVTFYAIDEDHFICTADNLYLRGSLVGEDKALVWNEDHTIATWAGALDLSGTKQFTVVKKNQVGENLLVYDHDFYTEAQTFDGDYVYGMFTLDLTKMTGTWGYVELAFADEATDNTDAIAENNERVANVTINRTIEADNTWYTLCLPFDMDADKVSEVFGASTIATLVGSEDRGSLIHLNFDYVSAIQAGKPYLIKPGQTFTAGTTISGVTIKNVDPSAAGYKAVSEHMYFQGTFNKIMLQGEDKRYVSENNELYAPNPDGGSAVGAFRCYFTIPDGSPALAPGKRAVIVFGPQQSTGIDQVVNGKCENAKIMLDGVLYIIRDGKTYNAQGMLIK